MHVVRLLWILAAALAVGAPCAAAAPPLTLAEAQARVAARSADLAALEAAVRAAEGERAQAAALPNPSVALEVENAGGDLGGFGRSEWTWSVEQPVETGGKRARRVAERARAVDVARADLEAGRRDLAAETRRRFVRALGLAGRVRTLDAALATADEIAGTVAALVRAGEASGIEELRARNEVLLARAERDAAALELDAARRELAALWRGAPEEAAALDGTLDAPVAMPSADELERRLDASPELARVGREVERLAAGLALQRRNRWPDVGVRAGWRRLRESSEGTYIAALAVPLPLFDRNAGAIRAAAAGVERGREEREATAARLAAELGTARTRFEAAAAQVALLGGELLPNVQRVLDATTEGYRRGKFRLLDLLDARRTLLAAQLRHTESLVQRGIALADIERLVGPLAQESSR